MKLVRQEGYTIIELLVSLAILGVVMGAVTVLFVQASTAEIDLRQRFEAQQSARLALDKLRRETHCASAASVATASSVTLRWRRTADGERLGDVCTVGSGTRFALGGRSARPATRPAFWADYLTTGSVFAYTPQSTTAWRSSTWTFPSTSSPRSRSGPTSSSTTSCCGPAPN